MTDVKAGKKMESDHAGHLKEFDALLAGHKDEKTDAVAHVLYMKSRLYAEIFGNEDQATEILKHVQRDYPETKFGKIAAQELSKPESEVKLSKLLAQIMADAHAGKNTEASQADHIKELDALFAQHKNEKTDDVAHILYMKSRVYTEIFSNDDKAAEILRQVRRDYPDTKFGKMAAQELAKPETEVKLSNLLGRIATDARDGKNTEASQAEHIRELDALFAKHQGEKTDDTAHILYIKSKVYSEVFKEFDKAAEIMKQLMHDYPATQFGQTAAHEIAVLDSQNKCQQIQDALAPGTKFPDFDELDLAGKPLSIASHKGKVVLLDFWATWCGPCRGDLPHVIRAYEKYHDQGFDVIGISLDDDQEKLSSFLKQNKIAWQQNFGGKAWDNKLAVKYGIMSIPATFLIDGEGKIIVKGVRGPELEDAVVKALAKK